MAEELLGSAVDLEEGGHGLVVVVTALLSQPGGVIPGISRTGVHSSLDADGAAEVAAVVGVSQEGVEAGDGTGAQVTGFWMFCR